MKHAKNILVILFAISLLACNKEETKHDQIIPVAEGNIWKFQDINLAYNETDTSVLEIGKEITIEGHTGFLAGGSCLIRSDEQGNTVQVGAFSQYDTVFSESILYKCYIKRGESFDYHMIISGSGSQNFTERTVIKTCTGIDTLISTPAGAFKCLVFEYSPDNGGNIFKEYLCRNIGRIKSERFEGGSLFSTSSLIEYHLK